MTSPAANPSTNPSTAPTAAPTAVPAFITPAALLEHWQGNRRLTRRVIDAFPEDQLFSFSVGGMRPFGTIALELLSMAEPTVRGIVTGEWSSPEHREPVSKADLLRRWDESSARIEEEWPRIPAERFQETMTAFGQWTMPVYELVLYIVDNELHHRGQGYVYLRALGIEPPPFHERD